MSPPPSPRQFTLTDQAPASVAYGSACRQRCRSAVPEDSPVSRPFGPAGEALPENGYVQEDAAAEWLVHVLAGRIGPARLD